MSRHRSRTLGDIAQDWMETLLRDNGWRVLLLPRRTSPTKLMLVDEKLRVGVRTSRPGKQNAPVTAASGVLMLERAPHQRVSAVALGDPSNFPTSVLSGKLLDCHPISDSSWLGFP